MIRRAEHSVNKKFFLFSRKTAQDKQLSFQAKGLLAYVLSKPSDWSAKDADLMKMGGIKRHALNSILEELKLHGYARRVEERQKNGKFAYILEIAEEPVFKPDSPLPDYPIADEPLAENQVAAIDSTRAGAGSTSIPKTDLTEKKPSPKRGYKPPEPETLIDPPFHGREFLEALTKFETVKTEIKSPLTPTSREALYCKLAKFDEETATIALAEAAAGGYKGVFPERVHRGNGNGKSHEPDRPVWMACKKRMLPDGTWVDDK